MDTERRAHILQVGADSGLDQLTQQRGRALFNGQSEAGRTAHVVVYSDGTPAGDATAQAVLASAEDDFQATAAWFGGIELPAGQEGDDQTVARTATPVQVLIDPQAGGAYHFGCDATDIYIEPTPELASGFFVAELVEIFEAASATGWDCGQTNGEGLSRVLAGERNPNLGSLFVQTEQGWWANGHADYTSDNSADDTNQDANGCATLYLYYLHSQLGYDWATMVAAGGGTLAETYTRLSGQDGASGFSDFITQLSTLDVGGFLNVPASGNPFPIGAASAPAQPQPGTEQGQPVLDGAPEGAMVGAEDAAVAAGTLMPKAAAPEGAMPEAATPQDTLPQDTAPGVVDVVEHHIEVYEAVPVGDAAGTDQPVYAIYETAVETQYPLSAGAGTPSSDSGDDGQAIPADDQAVADAEQAMPADEHTAVGDGQAVQADDDTMPDMPAQSAVDAPANDLMPDMMAGADTRAGAVVLDYPAQAEPHDLDVLDPVPPMPEPTIHLPPETSMSEMGVAEMPVAEVPAPTPAPPTASPEPRAVGPAPYLQVAPAPKGADAVETMIGVLVVVIVLVLLALLTVLFAGGIIHR